MAQMKIRGNTQIMAASISVNEIDANFKSLIYSGIDHKASVRMATTGVITLSGTQTIDGVVGAVDDRVLVKDQVDPTTNGIYLMKAAGWIRATDADSDDEVTSGMTVYVTNGTVNGGSLWTLITNDPITLGTSILTFTQSGGMSTLVAGNGLSASGNILHVGAGNGIAVDTDSVRVNISGTPGLEFSGNLLQVKVDNATIERVAAGVQVKDNGISNAKLRDSAALSVIGRGSNTVGDPADIAAAADGNVLRRSGTTLGFGQVATDGIANDAVTYAKMQNISATATLLGRKSAGAGDPEEIGLDTSGRGSKLSVGAAGIKVVDTPSFSSVQITDGVTSGTFSPGDGVIELNQVLNILTRLDIYKDTFTHSLAPETTTSSRVWTLPNKTGVLALREDYVAEEVPAGLINGTNVTFTLANTPISGSLILYLNGVRLRSGAGNDFTITGSTITMQYAPQTGDMLLATYVK